MLELTSVHHYFLRSFPMGKKNPFCNPWGHCCGWTNEIRCFYLDLSLEKVWHCLQQPIWTYNSLGSVCSLRKTSRIYPCPTIIRFILTRKNLQDLYHWLFQTTCKLLENCTHYSSRYLYGPYMAVPPHPARRVFPAFIHMLITKIITVNGLNPGCTFFSGFLFTTAKVVFITAMIIFHYSSPRSSLYDFHIFISSSSKKTLWPIPRGRGGGWLRIWKWWGC